MSSFQVDGPCERVATPWLLGNAWRVWRFRWRPLSVGARDEMITISICSGVDLSNC